MARAVCGRRSFAPSLALAALITPFLGTPGEGWGGGLASRGGVSAVGFSFSVCSLKLLEDH
jgi:hypothetical protein